MNRVLDKVALVTGAGTLDGIGAACARALADEGAKVAVSDIDLAGAERVAATLRADGLTAIAVQQDVSDERRWTAVVEEIRSKLGLLTVLVANAGIGVNAAVEDLSVDQYRATFAVNMDGVFFGTRAVLPGMREANSGSIINISSAGGIVGDMTSAVYGASKAAIRLFTKGVALEAARKGWNVRVNSIHPGLIGTATAFRHMQVALGGSEEQALALLKMRIPMARPGRVEEVASAAVYLASDEASYTTGTEIVIDGGMTAE
jgi:NAD(P)-dependent dehydrogenase (short-subunit alcohol dehydrogenase family)